MQPEKRQNYVAAVICITLTGIALIVRTRLLDIPFERDEGEYAYAGQVILSGGEPYRDVYNMKFPGVYYCYALIMAVLGQTVTAVHLSVLLLNLATAFLIYKTGRLLYNAHTGIIAAAIYAILSAGKEVLGVHANAEHFVVFFATAGFFLLLRSAKYDKPKLLMASGVLFGIAVMMKQHGALFACAAFVILLLYGRKGIRSRLKSTGILTLGLAIPFLIWCGWAGYAGIFGKFYFLTVQYAREYVSYISPRDGLRACLGAFTLLTEYSIAFWIFAALGAFTYFFNTQAKRYLPIVLIYTVFSFLAVCPGFYFRPHYWLLLVPAVSLLAAMFLSALVKFLDERFSAWSASAIFVAIFGIAVIPYVYQNRGYFFHDTISEVVFSQYGYSPFGYAKQIGEFIEKRTEPGDRIGVLDTDPEILFYARRKSATGYIYLYPLWEEHKYADQMVNEWIAEIESSNPAYLVYFATPEHWHRDNHRKEKIRDWSLSYTAANYTLVAYYELSAENTITVTEGEKVLDHQVTGVSWMTVYKRNSL